MGNFEFFKPKNLEEALKLASQFSDRVRLAAGCTNLLPDVHSGKLQDFVFVDIYDLQELKGIKKENGTISLGSCTTISEICESDLLKKEAPILHEAAFRFADPVVRNRATVGGNLAFASPASDMSVSLLVLDAVVLSRSLDRGTREIPLSQFFLAPGKTSLLPSEIILGIRFPIPASLRFFYSKLGKRNAMAISIASLGMGFKVGEVIEESRIALGALAPTPLRASKTERFLTGKPPVAEVFEESSEILLSEINPISDIRGSREYRLEATKALFLRGFSQILSSKGGKDE
ncbi:MAG: xanthine dehydrogenase family protein subunit M [Caldiserica bacterium]|nr:xanthine dehydrogenase family protein subunit M [Caldisericota bacterium]MDH7563048.1 xanthine dehydrogenase family protein subunit M [Caldisericota bacterium]